MNRFYAIAIVFAAIIGLAALGPAATAEDKVQLASKCIPMEHVLVSTGTKNTEVARAATQLMNEMRKQGLEDFIVLEGGGHKVLCGSPDAD